MTEKELLKRAISIERWDKKLGKLVSKKYIQVADRVEYFNKNNLSGAIETQLLTPIESKLVIFKATVFPNKSNHRHFTGHSQSSWKGTGIARTNSLEVAETSSVGRALGFMGIGVIGSIASADEILEVESGIKMADSQTKEDIVKLSEVKISKAKHKRELEKISKNVANAALGNLIDKGAHDGLREMLQVRKEELEN